MLRYFFVTSQQNKNTSKMNGREDIVFSRNTVEFVTVAAEFCAYIERSNEHDRKDNDIIPLYLLKNIVSQTFSFLIFPRIPEGLTRSINIRIENSTASVYGAIAGLL